jgi:8-oxo-dGTP diphosphatase
MGKRQQIAVCMFLHKGGKLFVAKRSEHLEFLPGVYNLPGGRLQFGESAKECLIRKAKSELGIDIVLGDPFYTFTYVSHGGDTHVIEVIYLVKMKDEGQEVKLDWQDHTEYQWVTEDEVGEYLGDNPEELKAAKKGFEILSEEGEND